MPMFSDAGAFVQIFEGKYMISFSIAMGIGLILGMGHQLH